MGSALSQPCNSPADAQAALSTLNFPKPILSTMALMNLLCANTFEKRKERGGINRRANQFYLTVEEMDALLHICPHQAYTGTVVFIWDPRKAAANLKKHGIDFREAVTVLDDALSTTFPDIDHSSVEPRFLTIGVSSRYRVLVVVHTDEDKLIRIISARRATRRERRYYEED